MDEALFSIGFSGTGEILPNQSVRCANVTLQPQAWYEENILRDNLGQGHGDGTSAMHGYHGFGGTGEVPPNQALRCANVPLQPQAGHAKGKSQRPLWVAMLA